jgi:hypothetical protein
MQFNDENDENDEHDEYNEYNDNENKKTISLFKENEIDYFIIFESENIFNLYNDLKSRYPYFLNKMNAGHLELLLVKILFNHSNSESYKKPSTLQFYKFLKEYRNEINTIDYVLNKSIKKFINKYKQKNYNVNTRTKIELLCFRNTDFKL